MKSLVQYIRESEEGENQSIEKTLTFNFSGLEDCKETIDTLIKQGESSGIPVSSDEDKVTIEFSSETFDKATEIIQTIKDFVSTCNSSGKRSSDESYAQKVSSIEKQLEQVDELSGEIQAKKDEEEQASDKTEDEQVDKEE